MLLLFAVDSVTFTSCVIRSTWLLRSDRQLGGRTLKISRTSLAAKLGLTSGYFYSKGTSE